MTGFSFVHTYPFTLNFKPPIDPVIIEFCRFFDVCLGQIGPIVWRVVACLRHLTNMVGLPFTFFHLIHLYSPKLFRHGIFTLVARSKRVLVSPEDDKDRGWYARFVVAPTVGLVGQENVPFPEKWNFARKFSFYNFFYLFSLFCSLPFNFSLFFSNHGNC